MPPLRVVKLHAAEESIGKQLLGLQGHKNEGVLETPIFD
jgi:hypothetical protein